MSNHSKKGNSFVILLILCLLIVIIGLGGYLGYKYMDSQKNNLVTAVANPTDDEIVNQEEKKIEIFNSEKRPVACMIDNSSEAWPQFAINDAYIVYEIIVEGGETRLMAVFKEIEPEKVGPMRSSRHYFLDYALENDAIYAHIGWSPQAKSDIKTLGVNNINGLEYDTGKAWQEGDVFWRISGNYKIPHNSIANIKTIKQTASQKEYRTTSSKKSVLKYVTNEVNLEEREDSIIATNITIPISYMQNVNFKYNTETKKYTRYARNKLQTDANSEVEITTKNIIITIAENYTLQDSENKGRQGLKNIGVKNGYYITNGQAIPITCTKNSRSEQTVYADTNGIEIDVNDGNTFIEFCPTSSNITFE